MDDEEVYTTGQYLILSEYSVSDYPYSFKQPIGADNTDFP